MKEKNKNIKKNFIWNTFGTTVNSLNSLFFLITVTRINGVDKAGIFSFAFSLACVFFCIGNYSTRTFQVTETDKNLNDNDFIYNRVFSCFLMVVIALLYTFIKGYNILKVLVIISLILYKMIEAFSESIYAIIQKHEELYKVGISMFIKGIGGLVVFILIDVLFNDILLASASLILTNILILILYDIRNVLKYKIKKTNFDFSKVIKLFKTGFHPFLFTFLTLYVINAPKYAIDNLLANEYQTIFGIIVMPATVMILCSQFLIQPFLTSLSKNVRENNFKEFNKMTFKIIVAIILIGACCVVGAWLIGIPFLELIYGIKLNKYVLSLVIIIIGATCFGISYVLSAALTTIRHTKSQSIIFIITSVFAYFVSAYLVSKSGVWGASLSYSLSMIFLLVLYIINYIIIIKREGEKNG